jgi:hypothetical protein
MLLIRGTRSTQPFQLLLMDGMGIFLWTTYTLSVAEVYESFAAHLITRDANLEIHKYCQFDQIVSGLPSWVLVGSSNDWPRRLLPRQKWSDGTITRMYKANLDTKARLSHGKQVLRVQGIAFEDVAHVSRACGSNNVHNEREA